MKATYIIPETTVLRLDIDRLLLQESVGVGGETDLPGLVREEENDYEEELTEW